MFIPPLRCLVVIPLIFFNFNVCSKLLNLLLILLNHFLAEMTSFGQLTLHLSMVNQILRQLLYYLVHLVVLVHLVLSLFGLVLEFTGQRCILDHCQLRGAHQLIFIHIQHFYLDGSDLQQHLFSQVVDLNHFFFLNHLHLALKVFPLCVPFLYPVIPLLPVLMRCSLVLFQVVELVLKLLDLLAQVGKNRLFLCNQVCFVPSYTVQRSKMFRFDLPIYLCISSHASLLFANSSTRSSFCFITSWRSLVALPKNVYLTASAVSKDCSTLVCIFSSLLLSSCKRMH